MARDFEDHCWKDVIDADTIAIYQAYRRKTCVGDNPAVLAIDLYNKAYLGGNRPVREVDREFSGSCGEHAWKALPLTQKLFAAARRARVPVAAPPAAIPPRPSHLRAPRPRPPARARASRDAARRTRRGSASR